jgi:hypothetical protein
VEPQGIRNAVAGYVTGIHESYLAQIATFPPGVQGSMPLLMAGPFMVAAVAVRHLHIIATTEQLGPLRGQEVEVPGLASSEAGSASPELAWRIRFFDPVVLPALGLVNEQAEPALAEVRRVLGIGTVLYHLTAGPGSTFNRHNAAHVGTGLASSHSAVARDFETIRQRASGREDLVDELAGASRAGLRRAQALLAAAIAPRDEGLAALAASPSVPDPDEVRKLLLASLGGRTQWSPEPPPQQPEGRGGSQGGRPPRDETDE